ncbi:cytochrome P450 [Amylocystis lapponica]|nr:cytochrome P450 [Amylocystis lapponica]
MPSFIYLVVAMLFLAILLMRRVTSRRSACNLPPGPRGWPLIGNVFDMPPSCQWKTFAKWGDRWGGIVSVTVFGQPMIILNAPEHAFTLLAKRSAIYSDRPPLYVAGRLVGWAQSIGLAPYGPHFREMRKLFSQLLGSREEVAKFTPLLETETRLFLLHVMQQPENVIAQVRKCAGAIILKMSYGYEVQQDEDRLVNAADVAMGEFALASSPGAFLVDLFPILKNVPSWVPGTGWRKTATAYAKSFDNMCNLPHEFVKEQMAAGTAIPSFTSMHLQSDTTPEREYIVKMTAASIYAGGADTTVSAISSFFLAMTCYPEVQMTAQFEIDSVIGTDTLPTLDDCDRLPYVRALWLEVLRWNPVGPLDLPHRLMEDDVYEGYFLPKGSIVIANIWKFLHDPKQHADLLEFKPERFLPSNGKDAERDPREVIFGFGRRVCPGMYLADASVFLSCAMSLEPLQLQTLVVENGVVVEPATEYLTGTISHPPPFKCDIRPRSARAEALIRSVESS